MKKHNWMPGIIIAGFLVLCLVLVRQYKAEHEKIEYLCQASASMALENFNNYTINGKEYEYMSGVAEFRSFMNAYLFLNDNVGNAEYTWCNIVYGEMLLYPEKVQADMHGLIEALAYLSEDYDHPNGFQKIHAYSNQLLHGND